MSPGERIPDFETFWPYYLGEHRNRLNRRLHFVGTSGTVGIVLLAALLGRPILLLALPVCGYGFAWVGHFFVEKNRPATFSYPWWSLRGDFRMVGRMWLGKLQVP